MTPTAGARLRLSLATIPAELGAERMAVVTDARAAVTRLSISATLARHVIDAPG